MSDEAFARRFYSDRAELHRARRPARTRSATSSPARSSTRCAPSSTSCRRSSSTDDELAALQTCLYLLEGKFAYAEPLRLALQNLALGRPGLRRGADRDRGARRGARPRLLARDAGPAGASSRPRSRSSARSSSPYWSISRDERARADDQPVRALPRQRRLVRDRPRPRRARTMRTFRVSRIRGDIRFATRRERDFRLPADFDVDRLPRPPAVADRRRRRRGADRGRAATPPGGSSARTATAAGSRTASSSPSTRASPLLASWVLRQDGRAVPLEPRTSSGARSRAALRRVRERHEGEPPSSPPSADGEAERDRRAAGRPGRTRALRASSRRCSPTCSTAAARSTRGRDPGARARRALPASRPRSSRSTSRCSTSSTSAAAATRSTPSSTATRCTSTRSSSATRSARRRA